MTSVLLGAVLALLQPSSIPAAGASVPTSASAPAAGSSFPSAPPALPAAPEASASESPFVVQDAVQAYEAAKRVMNGPTVLGVSGLVAVLSALAVKLLRRGGRRLLTQRQVNRAVVIASALLTGASLVVPGMAWWQAVFVGCSPIVLTLGHGDHPSARG